MNNGKDGENLFQFIMESRNYQVNNVSNNPSYWDQDIDFIISSPTTGAVKSFEVKWDSVINKSGNLFLEYYAPRSKGCRGWFEFCKADYLVYGDSVNKIFYVIPMPELRERVQQLPQRRGRTAEGAEGLLVSIGQIEDLIKVL